MTKTGWYDGSQKPLPDRVGPYLRDYGLTHQFSWWNGKVFGCGNHVFKRCAASDKESLSQSLPWRGYVKIKIEVEL